MVILGPPHFHINVEMGLSIRGEVGLDFERDCTERTDLSGNKSYIIFNSCAIVLCVLGSGFVTRRVFSTNSLDFTQRVKSDWPPARQWVGSLGWGARPGPVSQEKLLRG